MADQGTVLTPGPRGLGGWLLLYVVLGAISIVVMLVQLVRDLLYAVANPALLPAELFIVVLSVVWYGLYALALYHIVRLHPGAVARIKKIIVGTVLVNAVLPFLFAMMLTLTVSGAQLMPILRAAYSAETLGNLFGMCVMAAIWYRYFCVSERVRNTWPEVGEGVSFHA